MEEIDDIFIGREEEQKDFKRVLSELLTTSRHEERPIVLLMWGLGDIGKSTLTRRFFELATVYQPFEGNVQAKRLDWQLLQERPRLKVSTRDQLDPEAVLDAVVDFFDPHKRDRAFRAYYDLQKEQEKARTDLADLRSRPAEANRPTGVVARDGRR